MQLVIFYFINCFKNIFILVRDIYGMNKLPTNYYVNEIKKIKNKIGNEDRILRLDNPLKKLKIKLEKKNIS